MLSLHGDRWKYIVLEEVEVNAKSGVGDGDKPPAPHLTLHHVQQEAELTLLSTGVTAAPSRHEPPDVRVPLPQPLAHTAHPLTVPGDLAAVELLPAGGEAGGVDDDHLAWRAGEEELRGVTAWHQQSHHRVIPTFIKVQQIIYL